MSEIKFENVSFVYGEGTPFRQLALDNINITFKSNCITGLIGHTGSGKSTLASLINGIERPTEGKITLDGKDIWEDPKKIRDVRFKIGIVFQYPEYQLFEETVYKDIAYGPKNMGKNEAETDEMVRTAIRFAGLSEEILDRSPFELSGGQKRRVAIAGVMAMDPEVLVLDEPAAGLDPIGRAEIIGGISSYRREKNKTIILISHSMEDIAKYADELVVLNKGRVLLSGSVDEVFTQAKLIEESGLSLPEITKLMIKLREKGLDVPTDIYKVEDARSIFLRLKRENGKC